MAVAEIVVVKTMFISYFNDRKFLKWICAAFGCKHPILQQARKVAEKNGKHLLNVGCGSAYTELSDVNLDIARKAVPNFYLVIYKICGCSQISNLELPTLAM